jgi:dihydrofolate reductase/thymidylate synthase
MTFLILARDQNDGIGRNGQIPWWCPDDTELFRAITTHTNTGKRNLVIAGHRTRQSMPATLKDRVLVTLDRDGEYRLPDDTTDADVDQVFLAGGKAAMQTWYDQNPLPECLILTRIDGSYDCDVTVTDEDLWLDEYRVYATKRLDGATTTVYVLDEGEITLPSGLEAAGLRHDETQYLDLVREILETGEVRQNERTGAGTKSVFGRQLRFDLSETFPLLTTKRVFFRGVVEELAWFLNGDTDSKTLERKRVNIWKGNTSRAFLDGRDLPYPEGVAGPVYGAQWRHWGGEYFPTTGASRGGTDQIENVIESLTSDPESRRHVVSAWNPGALHEMALPPCHALFQFYATAPHADGKRRLKCQMYQRSCDVALGLPFNIASYALLTHIIAKACDMVPDELVISLGDCHIYMPHEQALRDQLDRPPLPFPRLSVVTSSTDAIEEFLDDPMGSVTLDEYVHHGTLQMEMIV